MFEVIIQKNDGTKETWDCLTEIQAECVFFRARMMNTTAQVQINEVIEFDIIS